MTRAATLLALALAWPATAAAGDVEMGLRGTALLFQIERGPGVVPGGDIEIGYAPGFLGSRVRLSAVWGMSGIGFDLEGEDERIFNIKGSPSTHYEGSIELTTVTVSLELAIRILPRSARVSPYVVWRPRLMLARTVSDLSVGDADLGAVHEWRWYLTAEGGIGLEVRIGGGRVFAELAAGFFPLDNETIGNATSLSLVAAIGYRHSFAVQP